MAGATDLMLEGTVTYLGEVLTRYASGRLPDAIVNDPPHPRVPRHATPRDARVETLAPSQNVDP